MTHRPSPLQTTVNTVADLPIACGRSSSDSALHASNLTHMLLHGRAAGAQALVAWSLQQAFPDAPLQMVAEEDAADLRCASDSTVIQIGSHRHWHMAWFVRNIWPLHPATLAAAGVTTAQCRPWPRASPSW
jgi:hypothetical protein